jgi:hypothetical protein
MNFLPTRIALIYDFDSTLTPLAMQEYTVFPKVGITAEHFWREVEETAERENADRMLTWMRLMLERIEDSNLHLGKSEFQHLAKNIKYFPGVDSWFKRIDSYVKKNAPSYITVDHYLISAGLKEILEGTSIRRYFRQIYASEYHYDHHGVPRFPKVLINDTMKTQFLFRINKGKELLHESINEHMAEADRPVPFHNMIYIGDGLSDVPSMTVTKKNGGFAIAVHRPKNQRQLAVCRDLLNANRVDYFAPADYSAGKPLEAHVDRILDLIIARIEHQHAIYKAKRSVRGR